MIRRLYQHILHMQQISNDVKAKRSESNERLLQHSVQ